MPSGVYSREGKRGSMLGRHHTEETKQRMSESRRGTGNAMYGKHHSEETKKKLSLISSGENSPWWGKHHSKESIEKMSTAKKGVKRKPFSEGWKRNLSIAHSMEKHGNWKGGKIMSKDNYVQIRMPSHPNSSNGYIYEHRLVMSKHIGRPLHSWEIVHHINGIRTDNRVENLELLPKGEHNNKVQEIYKENQFLKEQLANFLGIGM